MTPSKIRNYRRPGTEVVVETYRAWFDGIIVNRLGNGLYNVRSHQSGRVVLVNGSSIRMVEDES